METLAFRSGGSILNIATLPSFGNRWLLPRIGRFTEAYPQVALNVMARQWPFDLTQENIDAAILYAASPWPGGPSERLLGEEVVPVCFEQFDMIIRAAIAGAGVGLVPRFMVEGELAAGLLEAPFPRGMKSAESYYLVYPERKRSLPALQLFRAWILGEAQPGGAEADHS